MSEAKSSYRSVNFADLCRLCAATQGVKVNVFSAEGRKQDLAGKINEGLPVRVEENDELPKNICELCVQQVLQISEYRQKCCNTDTMFRGCLGSPKLKNEGRVYIKDEPSGAGPGGSKPATNIVTLKNMKQTTLVSLGGQQQQQHQQQQQTQQIQVQVQHQPQQIQIQQQTQQLDQNTVTISGNDYLGNIVQSVGIKQMEDGTEQPQYTYTFKELPQQQQQSLNEQQRLQTYSQMDEFLKPKEKPQYNLVLNQNQIQQITNTSQSGGTQHVKQVLTNNTPFVLTTNSTSGIRTVTQQTTQQQQQGKTIQMIQTSPQKQQCMIIKDNSQQVYQLKLDPQMSTVDGQAIYQLGPATTFQSIAPQQQQQTNKLPLQLSQLTTLTNVASNSAKGSPTMITIQDTPGKGQTATQITPVGRIASTTITRKTPLVLKQGPENTTQVKYVTSQSVVQNVNNSSAPILVQSAANNGTTKVTANKMPRAIVVSDQKAVKMISTAGQQNQVKTVTVTQAPKMIPLQTVNSIPSGEGTLILEMDKPTRPSCDICQKEFKRKEHLAQHMKLHEGVRPFKCEQCDKAFNRKEHLLRHRTSHTGAKSFKCEHCQKMFSRKDNLNKHKRKHTGEDDGEDVAGKSFKSDDGTE